jgi:histidinol-phosphate phosphatase family protein
VAVKRRALFLDKDGTLIVDVPFNVDPARVALASGAGEALRRFASLGFQLIVVSNQPGVALGLFPERALRGVEAQIQKLLRPAGVAIDAFFYCTHAPPRAGKGTVACLCRKPQPGLLRRAASDWHLDLARSWLVGDILDDIEAGRSAGCRTAFVLNGGETEWRLSPRRHPDVCSSTFAGAARAILDVEAAEGASAALDWS